MECYSWYSIFIHICSVALHTLTTKLILAPLYHQNLLAYEVWDAQPCLWQIHKFRSRFSRSLGPRACVGSQNRHSLITKQAIFLSVRLIRVFWNIHYQDDVIKWKHFPCHWPIVRGIHWSPLNSPHKGQWRGALRFSLICAWINRRVNSHEAGDLRRRRVHYDVIVMY